MNTAGALRPSTDHLPDASDVDQGWPAGHTLVDIWIERWRAAPSSTVLVDADGRRMNASELEERSAIAAFRLRASGVAHGERILVSAAASLDFVVAYVGVLRCGAVALTMNSSYREREIGVIVTDASPVLAITDAPPIVAALEHVAPRLMSVEPTLEGLPMPTGASHIEAPSPHDPALLVYTSGTTGAPKGVPLTHQNLAASALAVTAAWRWTPTDRLALALPLFHLHGLGVGLHGTLAAGACAELLGGFDASRVLESITRGATMFFGVPTMWHRLAAHPDASLLRSLRLGVSGSAPLSPAVHAAITQLAGTSPLERYGMSETVMLTSNPFDGERRAGSVGFPLPGVDVRIAHSGADGVGEIEVRGPNVFGGYWMRPDATAEAYRDGWFRTGDVGRADDGYLRIVGRAKELVISGGYNVYPVEVEDILRSHPAVADAAVVGLPDEDWGELVAAAVVWHDRARHDDLATWCGERLAPYKRPRRWADVDAIPRNALGKVERDAVAALIR